VSTMASGLADNSVGRALGQIVKADLISIDEIGPTGGQHWGAVVLPAGRRHYDRPALGVASHSPFEEWAKLTATQAWSQSGGIREVRRMFRYIGFGGSGFRGIHHCDSICGDLCGSLTEVE
jgi:hypothetical protein